MNSQERNGEPQGSLSRLRIQVQGDMQLKEAKYKLVMGSTSFWLSTPYGMVCDDDVEVVRIVFDEMQLDLEYGPPLDSEPDHLDQIRSLHAALAMLKRRFKDLSPPPTRP